MDWLQTHSYLTTWLGLVVGVVLGHYLTRSWQREQWLRDSKKEESRELLTALTESYVAMVSDPGGEKDQEAFDRAKATALIAISSRIFIAEEINEYGIFEWWKRAVLEFEAERDMDKFAQEYSWINAMVVKIAMGTTKVPYVTHISRWLRKKLSTICTKMMED